MQHEVILGLSNGGTKKPIKLGISVGNYQDSGINTGIFQWNSASNTIPVEKWRDIFIMYEGKPKYSLFMGNLPMT